MKMIPLLCCGMVLLAAHNCFAAEAITGYDNENPDIYVVSGTESVKEANITLIVTYSGKSLEDISEEGSGNDGIIAAVFKTVNDFESGAWEFRWEPSESGFYDISVSAEHYQQPYTMSNVFIAANRSNLAAALESGSKTELEALFQNPIDVRALVTDGSIADRINNTAAVGDILYNIREELPDKSKIMEYADAAAYMQIFKETADVEMLDKAIEELEQLGVVIDSSELYKNEGSTEIKTNFASRLAGADWAGLSDFNARFTDELILAAVEKAGAWSDLDMYLSLLSNSTYANNRSNIARAVVSHNYNTIAELVAAIESPVSSVGGGGGAGGGGGDKSEISTNTLGQSTVAEKPSIDKSVAVKNDNKNDNNSEQMPDLAITFSDVPQTHWAFEAINYIRWLGMIYGYEDGSFRPEENITRAEFLTMLCNLFGVTGSGSVEFEDVASTDWYAEYIDAASAMGLVEGSDGFFCPNDKISRQDMAVMTYRFCSEFEIDMQDENSNFVDYESIADYARESIARLAGTGLVHGMDNGEFVPHGNTKRAEAAQILYNILMASDGSSLWKERE